MSAVRRITHSVAAALDHIGLLRRHFERRGGLRILCYHGVCADEVLGEPWVPSYFVGASNFARQIEIIQRFAAVVPLAEAVERAADGSGGTEGALAVTFDDAPACNFVHARHVLRAFGVRASFFVATGHATTGQLFVADVLRLLRCRPALGPPGNQAALAALVRAPAKHKRMCLDELAAVLRMPEQVVRARLDPAVREAPRPMNWSELQQLADEGHEIGAHTVDHAILGAQRPDVRRAQILDSAAEIERRLGKRALGFAYPNGGPGDFGPEDYATLREAGVAYALATRAGFADAADPLNLPRLCIGRGHTPASFALELSGLVDRRRLRQQRWR